MTDRLELPSKDEINRIGNLEELSRLETDIERVCAKINVDLATLTDDEEWHARARSALALHSMTLSWVRARIRRLTKGNIDHIDQYAKVQEAKAAKKEAAAKAHQARAEAFNASKQAKALNIEQRKIELLQRTCYLSAFKKAALRIVPLEMHQTIYDAADELYEAAIKQAVNLPSHPKPPVPN